MPFPATLRTRRLVLRPPTPQDVDVVFDLHSDPRLHTHAPHAALTDRAEAASMVTQWLDHWGHNGFGYWVAEDVRGTVAGIAGVRPAGDYANLAYRFAVDAHGNGFAREAARAAVAAATEWLDVPVRALVKEHNTASVNVALACGMERTGTVVLDDDLPDEPPSAVFVAPRVEPLTAFDAATYGAVLDLWVRVNDAGGAVGFVAGAPREQVAETLDRHTAGMAAGREVACLLRSARGDLLGIGWWQENHNRLFAHTRHGSRVMTDPEHRGRNLGRLLLAGMHRAARGAGIELAMLEYRSGYGLGDFYAGCGYTEIGRIPRAIRVGPDDDRDQVVLAHRLDGQDLAPDGRV